MADKFIGFRFNSNNGFDHLLRAIAAGAVADNTRTVNPLPAGATVVVLARVGEQYIAASGTATGQVLDVNPQEIWPLWVPTRPTKVHGVVFKTMPVSVPSEVARAADTTSISGSDAEDLAYFVFAHS